MNSSLRFTVDWESARVADAYTAAANLGTGFKLFISLDMAYVTLLGAVLVIVFTGCRSELPCATAGDVSTIRNYINAYAGHPNQLWYQDRLILSTFSGENCRFGQNNFNDGWNFAIRNGVSARVSSFFDVLGFCSF